MIWGVLSGKLTQNIANLLQIPLLSYETQDVGEVYWISFVSCKNLHKYVIAAHKILILFVPDRGMHRSQ